ncbi:MAG TPA: formate dehydrogenase [Usitatibacter sp.]|nr:formate dehydrogenase [Usitatibacter sp.]
MKTPKPASRRKFLLAAGLGGAGAAAVVATARKAASPGTPETAAAGAAEGYRVTAHIEKYYKTTEV